MELTSLSRGYEPLSFLEEDPKLKTA